MSTRGSGTYVDWKAVRRPYRCPICRHTTSTGSGLRTHLERSHAGLGIREMSLTIEAARREVGWPRRWDAKAERRI